MIGIGSFEALSAATVLSLGIAVKTAAESARGRIAAKSNPLYFIWEANKRA
jgi:hypothetical protein